MYNAISDSLISTFRRTKIIMNNITSEDNTGDVKFTITDPNTHTNKTISIGGEDKFIPRLLLTDDEVLGVDGYYDIQKLKTLCLKDIQIEIEDLTI